MFSISSRISVDVTVTIVVATYMNKCSRNKNARSKVLTGKENIGWDFQLLVLFRGDWESGSCDTIVP